MYLGREIYTFVIDDVIEKIISIMGIISNCISCNLLKEKHIFLGIGILRGRLL